MAGQSSFNDRVEAFCCRLVDRRINSSLAAAKGTAELLRQLVTMSRLNTPELLLAEVKKVGLRIQSAKPIGASPCRDMRTPRRRCPRLKPAAHTVLPCLLCIALSLRTRVTRATKGFTALWPGLLSAAVQSL